MLALRQGPRDNNAFRNLSNSSQVYFPPESSITYEGILNEYSYGIGEEFDLLFNTSFSTAIAKKVGNEEEYEQYLCLEMKSKYDGDGLVRNGGRPIMTFCFVLDISGSMHDMLSDRKTKIEVAKNCMISILSKLKAGDKFGLILFNTTATVLIPLDNVENIDMAAAKTKILNVAPNGGTSIKAGIQAAENMLVTERESINRIFFLTDMNPTSDRSCNIVDMARDLAKQQIYISVVGIGLDFNTKLTYELASVKGCNSFGVRSAVDFKKQMDEDFDYTSMVICQDVSLKFKSDEFEVEEIYGSPTPPNLEIGEVLKLDSVSPSANCSEGGIKGGIVVLKLKKKNSKVTGGKLCLDLSYNDWEGKAYQQENVVEFPADPVDGSEVFQTNSARKAVALVRYVKTVKQVLSNTEKTTENKQSLLEFKDFLTNEIQTLLDVSMEKEFEMLDAIIKKCEAKISSSISAIDPDSPIDSAASTLASPTPAPPSKPGFFGFLFNYNNNNNNNNNS